MLNNSGAQIFFLYGGMNMWCKEKIQAKRSLFAALMLQALILLMQSSAFATAEDGQEIGVPQAMEAPVKGCFGAVLSPDGDNFYTVREGFLTQYKINPFTKVGSIAIVDWEHVTKAEFITVAGAKIEVGVGRGCRVLMTNDLSKLIIIDRYRIFLLDARNGKILNKFERIERGRGMGAAVINDNDLLILDFDPTEQEDGRYSGEHGVKKISLVIWDTNTLKLKRKFNDLGESFGLVQDRLVQEGMSRIMDRIYLATAERLVVLNSKTYAPELVVAFSTLKISKNFRKLYVGKVSEITDYLSGKQTSYDNVKVDSVFVFDQETRELSIESIENVNSISPKEFALFTQRGQISRNKEFALAIFSNHPYLINLNTGMKFSFYQYESSEAILLSGDDKYFKITPDARKYLMMKNSMGKIVPINDATFTKYLRKE